MEVGVGGDWNGQAINMTVLLTQAMHPLRVILVRGSHTDLQAFAENIRSMTKAKVFTPSLGQVVNASMESHIYQVLLTCTLWSWESWHYVLVIYPLNYGF